MMTSFSRIIARPVPSIWEPSPPQAAKGLPEIPRYPWDTLPNMTIYGTFSGILYSEVYPRRNITHTSVPNRENDPVVSAIPIPRRRNPDFIRTESMGSIPSLCSDDVAPTSLLSCSPALSSPESPPPTACSIVAVRGSPTYKGRFGDEDSRPDESPFYVHMSLEWREQMTGVVDGGRRDAANKGGHSAAPAGEPTVPAPSSKAKAQPAKPATSAARAIPRALGRHTATKASRLSQRVQTPPPLNTSAINAQMLLAKLLHGAYDVEVGHTDGSAISDAESGDEGDDEGEYDSPQVRARYAQSGGSSAFSQAAARGKQAAKKSYAAVAAAVHQTEESDAGHETTSGAGEEAEGDVGRQEESDWTGMFARRGPLVEVAGV